MNPHDTPHIPSQVPPTRSNSKILGGIQPVGVNHEIPVILVYTRRLAPVFAREELRDRSSFDRVDRAEGEP